ncbi:sulfur oxidation c-type cytochrome SoxX [Pseudooceanicola nanhaiensis]|uniref:sulfur oxidation c-type cytochrome SoxX n=1 Tax=Pseudooceanicola nanhaiensis TaxID=375761 RepID=UPI001CD3985A|nr:sulfur oxidation c-type cytochrome SoxX [Pseudooceanicola nanhaiensis]MCA0919330.1 sulfur oxidation c-type cytochrome SoxX [Pseudooceanicola nanhaiensis]
MTRKLMPMAFVLAAGAATSLAAAEVAPTDVVYDDYGAIEAPLTDAPTSLEDGAKVMTTRSMGNCVACHAVTALESAPFHGEVGPSLDGVADRWSVAELRGIVANAKKTYDGTIMPAFYKTSGYIRPGDAFTGKAAAEPLPPLLTAQQIEDVVAFLTTLKE